jgi:hypothetical protein
VPQPAAAGKVANGVIGGGYESTRFKSKPTPASLESVDLLLGQEVAGAASGEVDAAVQRGVVLARGALLTRWGSAGGFQGLLGGLGGQGGIWQDWGGCCGTGRGTWWHFGAAWALRPCHLFAACSSGGSLLSVRFGSLARGTPGSRAASAAAFPSSRDKPDREQPWNCSARNNSTIRLRSLTNPCAPAPRPLPSRLALHPAHCLSGLCAPLPPARFLVESPPNVATPTYLAEAAQRIADAAPDVMKLEVGGGPPREPSWAGLGWAGLPANVKVGMGWAGSGLQCSGCHWVL